MPRKARLDIPGLLQHVIVRGIERRKIFLDDDDRRMFLGRFSSLLEETETDCFAWALIPNHFHLLIRCNKIELSTFMRRLLTGYAINFNHIVFSIHCSLLFENILINVCEQGWLTLKMHEHLILTGLVTVGTDIV